MKFNVSFYVAAYNAERTISRCLNSIINQSIKPLEIIVVNDGSIDDTSKILLNFRKNIKIINNPKNLGLAQSRNIAIKNSSSDYVAAVDADVFCSKNWLKFLLKDLVYKNIELVGGKLIELDSKDRVNKWRELNMRQNWGDKDILNPDFVFGCNTLLKKKIWENFFKYDQNYKTNGEDVNFSRRLREKNYNTFYNSKAICYHMQFDNIDSLSKRYWRYNYYGAGIKNKTFFKSFKVCIREIKKTILRIFRHCSLSQYKLIQIDFLVLIKYFFLEFKNYYYEKN